MIPSELIKVIRAKLGITQEELARAVFVTYTTVNRWENNKSTPNRMARALLIDYCKKQRIDKELIDAISKIR